MSRAVSPAPGRVCLPIVPAVACLILLFSATVHSQPRPEIRLGLVAPLTGLSATEGKLAAQAGADVVEAINQSGGLRGARVALHVGDDECNAARAREKAEELVYRVRVVATVGHCRSVARAVRDIYERGRVPLIVPNASLADLGGPSQFVFHLGVHADRIADVTARLARETRPGARMGAISDGSALADELIGQLRRQATIAYVLDLRISSGQPPALAELQRRDPVDVLFFAVERPDAILGHVQSVTGVPVILPGLPTASPESWHKFWGSLGSDARRVRVVAMNEAKARSKLGDEVLRHWSARLRSEGKRPSTPPDAYTTVVAAFELLAQVLTDGVADGSHIEQALRQRPRPTVIGELQSGETGSLRTEYSVYTSARQWTPDGSPIHYATANGGSQPPSIPAPSLPGVAPPPPAPPPPAPPPPAPAPPPPSTGEFAAYWNAWFERDRMITSRLDANKDYRFVLDLSRYQRRPDASAAVGPEASDILKSAKHSAKFTVRVLFSGGALRVKEVRGGAVSQTLNVDVARLYRTALSDQELDAWRKGTIDTSEFLGKASAGFLALDVVTGNEGCGAVAVSVWDGPGLRPLDHLTYGYAVGDPSQCPQHDKLTAGIGITLAISSVLEGGEPQKADAALHIFEFPPGPRDVGSVVWYVDRTEFESGERSGVPAGVYAWQTQSSLRQYVQTPSQLPALVQAARDAAASGQPWPYAKVAEGLRQKLFSVDVDNEETYGRAAQSAQAALEKLVNNSTRPPVIVARLAISAEALDYVPLGLLGARAEKPLLKKPFVTVQPLRRERFLSGTACVDPWTLGIPDKLSGLDKEDTLPQELASLSVDAQAWPHAWARDMAQLRQRFKRGGSPPAAHPSTRPGETRSEGVVLLAHHSDGNLWFDSELDRLVQEDFERPFQRGSVAVISACSVGGMGPLAYKLIDKLNARNVDTMIVSPFPVRVDFGVRLALHFVHEIDDARRAQRTSTIGEIYVAAWERTAKDFVPYNRDLYDMGLEFVILGDPNVRLCAR